ncbi:MAG: macro domain-containing protein [Litorilinea sp.]
MFEYKKGNIVKESTEAIVNTVNCVGIMGRGIALQFKKSFPENYKSYVAACKRDEVIPGRMFVFETDGLTNPRYIINFPTKRHWRGKSRMEDIESGLVALATEIRSRNIKSIAIPPLGSGLGGLDWADVRPRIEDALDEFSDCQIVIYEPRSEQTDIQINRSKDIPSMTAGRAALVSLIDRYLRGLLDPFVTLLEVHKLMYFMQTAGEPLQLKYNKGIYGPYAENLRHVLNRIEGHMISGYGDGGDTPDKILKLVPGALEEANTFLQSKIDTIERFKRVSTLVEGFESPFGLELLSTVHWLVINESVSTKEDVVVQTYSWNEKKRRFSERQIELAIDTLASQSWIKMLPAN